MKKFLKVIGVILAVILALALVLFGVMKLSSNHRSDPEKVEKFETTNPYIIEGTDVSAHRIGAGIAPEQTMMAIKNCVENESFDVDVFEFDLHITSDGVLVLLHDDTLDRTSDSEEVFGETEVRPENKTYDELRTLNMGAKFENEQGERPYADLKGEDIPDDLRIQRLEDVLDYLSSVGDYKYIIEIKNGGDLGRKGVDIMYCVLKERDMVEDVVFGTFNEEVSIYVDTTYTDLARSTSINEVIEFYIAALTGSKSYVPPCSVLQIPFCSPYLDYGINLGTAKVINYAHSHNMALQYWTINDREDMEYLVSMGADCIMTDYPDVLFEVVNN
ncbi:MAG: hypothetical protein E7660_07665 [Ruminococcaceae bacterium]|nr:hypothetical protein [Oscillospiraceae bacterium]